MQQACIACGWHLTHEVYHGDDQPLSVLRLPKTRDEAREVPEFPMNFRACAHCGHIFNVEFDYYRVPYEDDSNLMFNQAHAWRQYLADLVDRLVDTYDAAGKTLIDIGCGDGGFLKLLGEKDLHNRCVGFEPGIEAQNARKNGLEVYKDYFLPERDLKRLRPDFLICRHVIEHMARPRDFVREIAYWCNRHDVFPLFLAEVPRIDKAISQRRINDFLYEHPSNFTQFSFENMFRTCGYDAIDIRSVYGDEVVVGVFRAAKMPRLERIRLQADQYRASLEDQKTRLRAQLAEMAEKGMSVAFWGATGKGAAFLNAFGLDHEEYPLVIDSDSNKVGRFVPKTAQEIRPPQFLAEKPVDAIVITSQWRADDILHEIRSRNIPCRQVMVLVNQRLQILEEFLHERQDPEKAKRRKGLSAKKTHPKAASAFRGSNCVAKRQ